MKRVAIGFAASLLACSATVALAQEARERGVPVPNRARPEYDALGVRAGSFIVMPTVDLSARYDDNIFAEENNTSNDWIFVATPELNINSDWNNHALNFNTGAEIGRYADSKRENYEDWHVGADGRLDVMRETVITGGASYQHQHEERGSPNDVGGQTPTKYNVTGGNIGFQKAVTRITMRASANYTDYSYKDVLGAGNTLIDQSGRDRKEYGGQARLGYEFVPDVVGFVQGSYNWRRYDTNKSRNSQGYKVVAGTSFDLGGVTTGEAFVGYRHQSYDDTAFAPTSGVTYGGSLLWLPTDLTSVQLTLLNDVQETIQGSSSGFVASSINLRVDHELLRNLLLGANVGFTNNDYKGITRTEHVWEFGALAKYLINRNFAVQADYKRLSRSVNVPDADYDRNVITLRVIAGL